MEIYLLFFLNFPLFFMCGDDLLNAEILFSEGLFSDALPFYQKISSKNGNFQENLAYCLADRGSFEEACAILSKPTTEAQKLFLAYCKRQLKKEIEAIALLETYAGEKTDRAMIELALCYYQLGKGKTAQNILEKATSQEAKKILATLHIQEKQFFDADLLLSSLSPSPHTHYLEGLIKQAEGDLTSAAACFEKGPKTPSTREKLAGIYLELAQTESLKPMERAVFLEKSQKLLSDPLQRAYGWIVQGKLFQDSKAMKNAQDLLKHAPKKNNLLYSELSIHSKDRKQLKETFLETDVLGKGLYLHGIEALIQAKTTSDDRTFLLEEAIFTLSRSYLLLKDNDTSCAILALGSWAEAAFLHPSIAGKLIALFLLESLFQKSCLKNHPSAPYFFYNFGIYALQVAKATQSLAFLEKGKEALIQGATLFSNHPLSNEMLFYLGDFSLKENNYPEALSFFDALSKKNKLDRALAASCLFWKAFCLEKLGEDAEKVRALRLDLVKNFPESAYAPEAQFRSFSLYDYLQGEKGALKALMQFPSLFPNSPFVVTAWFLIGLDAKRDRKTSQGKWLRKKNLPLAIDAFQHAESAFSRLQKEGAIPHELMRKHLQIKYRAALERALANLAIAKESEGAKRRIYLEYAESTFQNIIVNYRKDPLISSLSLEAFPKVLQESLFGLSQAMLLQGKKEEAKDTLFSLTSDFQNNGQHLGYFLSRSWQELAKIAQEEENFPLAISYYSLSEKAASKNPNELSILSADQWLDLWIQKSVAAQKLGNWEEAMLLLSKVINQDVASSLRLKAMYLRAELLASLGKEELAKKQLIALSKKGSVWGEKAQKQLKETYGD